MKVLQFINSLSAGGAEKLLVDAVIKYHMKGCDVDILLISEGSSPFLERLKPFPAIKVMSLGKSVNVYNPMHILKLNRYFNKYDVIHVHLFPAMYWTALAKAIGKKKHKIVFTEHNVTNRRRNSSLLRFIDRRIYKKFDKIVSISNSVDQSLRRHLGRSFENIYKIYNGIDLQDIENAIPYTKSELNFPEDSFLIIQVSSFTIQKNQQTVIRSLLNLPDSFLLILVGGGPLLDDCKQLVKDLGLDHRVHFLGIRKDVPRLLKSVDLVVLSSHYEGLSLSSVEGLTSGKPFIASDVPGLTEVVLNAGILFPDNNEKKLAEIFQNLIDDKVLYRSITESCLIRAKKYDIDHMADQYMELYNQCHLEG